MALYTIELAHELPTGHKIPGKDCSVWYQENYSGTTLRPQSRHGTVTGWPQSKVIYMETTDSLITIPSGQYSAKLNIDNVAYNVPVTRLSRA